MKDVVYVKLSPVTKLSKAETRSVEKTAAQYAGFLGLQVIVT
jgi:hypothetical protein